MRAAVRAKLSSQISAIGSRVLDPHAAGPQTTKPFIVVRQGIESEDSNWSGFRRIIEIWPYIDETSFQEVDALVKNVKDALEKQLLTDAVTGEVFTCRYAGSDTQDYVDKDWKALTRCLRFEVYALQAVNVTDTISSDPWVTAIATYTAGILLPATWTVYKDFWPLGYKIPSVMWRVATVKVKSVSSSMFEIRKRIIGHVIGSTPNGEIEAVASLVEAIGQDIKIVTDSANRRYITVKSVEGNYQSDSITQGQITIDFFKLTAKPAEEVVLMKEVIIEGILKGGD